MNAAVGTAHSTLSCDHPPHLHLPPFSTFTWAVFTTGSVSVFQYRIGQLYMISKHSHEQSDRGEGVEVVQNEPFEDPEHGQGQFTEKRVYLNR